MAAPMRPGEGPHHPETTLSIKIRGPFERIVELYREVEGQRVLSIEMSTSSPRADAELAASFSSFAAPSVPLARLAAEVSMLHEIAARLGLVADA